MIIESAKEQLYEFFRTFPGVGILIEKDNEAKRKRAVALLTERSALVKVSASATGEARKRTGAATTRLLAARSELKKAQQAYGSACSGEHGVISHHSRGIDKIDLELEELAKPASKELKREIEKRERVLCSATRVTAKEHDDAVVEVEKLRGLRDRLNGAHLLPNLEQTISTIQSELRRSA